MGITEEFKAYFDESYERALPPEFLENHDIVECLSSAEACDTLLVKQKTTGKKMVAKCYAKDSILFDTAELTQRIPHFMAEYGNGEYRCVLREYIEGMPLDEFVKANYITEDIIIDIAVQLANAMKSLHDSETVIIHRDIKPQNIIVKEDGGVALIDFGISRVFKKNGTTDTFFGGTDDFAPPEQYGFMQTDIRSDIYSFGVVLSWMITGKAKPIKAPLTKLERVAAKCCAFSPDKRYKNEEALLKDLHKATRQHAAHLRKKARNFAIFFLFAAAVLSAMGTVHRTSVRGGGAVTFQEPLIEEAVRAVLDKPQGVITYADLENVTEIYIQAEEAYASMEDFYAGSAKWYQTTTRIRGPIRDISDLKDMPNLHIVYIGGEYIRDISPLKEIKYLQQVEFRDNDIEDISPLAGKDMLMYAGLLSNRLKSIEAVRTWPALRRLNISEAGNFDASPIETLNGMDYLDISGIPDAYRYLEGLYVDDLAIGAPGQTDAECIREVAYVARLYIRWSDIRDISALEGREDIVYLNMEACTIDDLSPLFTMPNLMTVEMSAKGQPQIEKLTAVYGDPAFEIIYTK